MINGIIKSIFVVSNFQDAQYISAGKLRIFYDTRNLKYKQSYL